MIWFITIVAGGFCLFTFPKIFVVAGFILLCIWWASRPVDLPRENEPEEGSYYFNMRKAAEEELNKRMKPGYKDDPEWIKLHNRLKRHTERAEQNAKDEMIAEQEKEIRDMKRQLRQNGRM